MTLAFCRIFNKVVQEGSFVKAAAALHMTPSAVSHAVSDAEDSLGFLLFSRTRAGISLTENGRALYPAILEMLQCDDILDQQVDSLKGLKMGTVKLGMFNSVCTNWMPDLFERFEKDYPEIQINIREGGYDDVVYWIKNGFVELGFLSTSSTRELTVDARYRDPLVCIVPEKFPNKKEGVITFDEMRDQHFIIQREGSDWDVRALFQKYHFVYHSSYQILEDTSIMTLIRCGKGISVMPMLTARGLTDGLKVLLLEPREYRSIGLSALDLRRLSPAAEKFYDCANAYMEELTEMDKVNIAR